VTVERVQQPRAVPRDAAVVQHVLVQLDAPLACTPSLHQSMLAAVVRHTHPQQHLAPCNPPTTTHAYAPVATHSHSAMPPHRHPPQHTFAARAAKLLTFMMLDIDSLNGSSDDRTLSVNARDSPPSTASRSVATRSTHTHTHHAAVTAAEHSRARRLC
jgi:hypothetical protein